jgi:purine-binding chemotaxis protein CheW
MARSKGGKSGKPTKPERGAPAELEETPAPAPQAPGEEHAPMECTEPAPAEKHLELPPDDPWERFAVEDLRASDDEGEDAPGAQTPTPPGGAREPVRAPAAAPAVEIQPAAPAGGEVSFPTQEEFERGGTLHPEVEEEALDLLCFQVAAEEFAIDIRRVWEIIRPRPVTELPRVPGFVSGIISLRGQIVPIIDLRARLGFPPAEEPLPAAKMVVATYEGRPVGMTVDAVSQKVRVPASGMDATPSMLGAQESGFLRGVYRHHGRLFAVLDADAVLAFDVDTLSPAAAPVEDRGARGEAP